jgi:hypothetical protein
MMPLHEAAKYYIQVLKSSLTLETSDTVEKATRRYGHARPSVPLSLLSPIVDLVYRGGGCTGMNTK